MKMNTSLARSLRPARLIRSLLVAVAAVVMAGCATANRNNTTLDAAGTAVRADTLSVNEVRQNPDAHAQTDIIWGGTIAKVEHRNETTVLEIVQRPLNKSDQPLLGDLSGGRFIATVPGFLDPTDFRVGQPLTVDGSLEGITVGKIGETAYDFPQVAVNDFQLWRVSSRLARNGHYRPYYSPLYSGLSIGVGLGHRSSIGFGFSNYGRFNGRFGRGGHRGGFRGGFRGSRRGGRTFSSGRSRF